MRPESPSTARPWLRHYDYWVRSNLSYPGRPLSDILNITAIERPDRPAGPDRQSAGRGRQRTHVQCVAGRKSVIALAGKGNAVDVPDHRSAVRSGLVE